MLGIRTPEQPVVAAGSVVQQADDLHGADIRNVYYWHCCRRRFVDGHTQRLLTAFHGNNQLIYLY